MARKDLLKGLMGLPPARPAAEAAPTPPSADLPEAPAHRPIKGAVGAVGQSIAELKSRALIEVSAELIDDAGLTDRLDDDLEGIAELARSMQSYGQQVPVLLRASPTAEGRYQIVYGRRRVQALKQLGIPVKAMVRDLKDRDLILAQGQENAARKDLSFIEKANFARQMRDSGFERALICDALSVDKTVISRMLTVVDAVPLPLLRAIGSAPSAGRNRWLELTERLSAPDCPATEALIEAAIGETSDDRFTAVLRAAQRPAPLRERPAAEAPEPILTREGAELGEVTRQRDRTQIRLHKRAAPGFDDWLVAQLASLHARFLAEKG